MESSDSEYDDTHTTLLLKRQRVTQCLLECPYDLMLYIERATIHSDLGYPDLAAGDAYRALLLADEVSDESFEYHEQAVEALQKHSVADLATIRLNAGSDGVNISPQSDIEDPIGSKTQLAQRASLRSYQIIAISLLLCGCLKSAYEFCQRGLAISPADEELTQTFGYIQTMAERRLKTTSYDIADLPDKGLVRREIYPWNDHEPDRHSQNTLDFLNSKLAATASKCRAEIVELPILENSALSSTDSDSTPTNKQLGLFAAEDIEPGETVLDEYSILVANNRFKENLCDACSTVLPSLSSPDCTTVTCEDCVDIMFCGQFCHDQAMENYHPAVCDKDIDTIGKDPDPKETPNALYLLLLARSLAMAATREEHPLDMSEVKYIWGDFIPAALNAVPLSPKAEPPPIWTLPFSFASNISAPLHILEKMDIDIWATVGSYDLWIFNTLYAKFRGTASARQGQGQRAGPEVAAVHPLWCLANHDCDPNVQWEWGGHMRLWARETRKCNEEGVADGVGRKGGIKKGEEILNHYCDIDLPVTERREWAAGSLGGWCMCARCRREAETLDCGNGVANHDSDMADA